MNSTIAKNTAALLLVQAANLLLPLVTFPYLTRVLGPETFGGMALSTAVVSYFVLLADYGFNLSATKRIAASGQRADLISEIFWSVLGAKVGLVVLGLLLLWIAVAAIPRLHDIQFLIAATAPLLLGSLLFPQWLFQGIERMSVVSISVILSRATMIPFTFALVHGPDDVWKAALINSSTTAFSGLISIGFIVRLRMITWCAPSVGKIIEALRDGSHVFVSTASISLYSTTNTVLLGFIAGDTAVGYFAAADRLRAACSSLISPLSNAVYPRVNALMVNERREAFALIRQLLWIQGAATMVISAGLFVFAPLIVNLVLGSQFTGAVTVLRWMAAIPFLVGLSNVFGVQAMLSVGMKREFSYILLASGLVNLMILVPLAQMAGAVGASNTHSSIKVAKSVTQ